MISELRNIETYFSEAAAQWAVNPELVISSKFFEIWENIHEPRPFHVTDTDISLCNESISLVEDQNLIGCFVWDYSEECCAMVVEGDKTRQTILIMFEDGSPKFVDMPVIFTDEIELSYGERLEVIYDIVAQLQHQDRVSELVQLSIEQYNSWLVEVEANFDQRTIRIMKFLPIGSIQKLIKKATSDMAIEELIEVSGPIADLNRSNATTAFKFDGVHCSGPTLTIPRRSTWTVLRELRILESALTYLLETEESSAIEFTAADVTDRTAGGLIILRIPLKRDLRLREGDRLPVFIAGEKKPISSLTIVLNDRDHIIASIPVSDDVFGELSTEKFVATPPRSPTKFIAKSIHAAVRQLAGGKSFLSPVLNCVLGIDDINIQDINRSCEIEDILDQTQERARAASTNADDPIVIIQGPPGTGKTQVLETVIRDLSTDQKRVLMTAPSNAAVDNVCRKVQDLPVLRLGRSKDSISDDVAESCWIGRRESIAEFKEKRETSGSVYCGTHLGLLRDELVHKDIELNGLFDVIIFDEAGMTDLAEFILCVQLAKRVVMFGDHQQLPPFPLPTDVIDRILEERPMIGHEHAFLEKSAMEWLIEYRGFFPHLLQLSYRCQNPRLMRFSSTLFYNARVMTSDKAEYYQLTEEERNITYPPSTLSLVSTSVLPPNERRERLVTDGKGPGLENELEARLTARVFYELLRIYPLTEISIIAPYRRQVRLIRRALSRRDAEEQFARPISESAWNSFLYDSVSTVDAFQGSESDAVIISYVRSNDGKGIGFVDDPNRINVAHTRCRREMVIIGDIECLIKQSKNDIFNRMKRGIARDGKIVEVTPELSLAGDLLGTG